MLNNKDSVLLNLRRLGLTQDESKVYLALLAEPLTHLEVARKTGVNRTKVYRLADSLMARSLITIKQRDDGKFLFANDPANLEITLATAQEKLKLQKDIFKATYPALEQLFNNKAVAPEDFFTIDTYDGVAGLKQMLWNELKTRGELLVYSHDTLDQVAGTKWAENYRAEITERGVKHRVLENIDSRHVLENTKIAGYKNIYDVRFLARDILDLRQELTIHDDTVSIYNWDRDGKGIKVGLEIHNKQFADFQRAIFETYWKLAEKTKA